MHNLTAIKKKKFLRRLGHILESANDDEILTNTYNLYVKKVLLFFLYGYFVLCYLKYILYPIYIFLYVVVVVSLVCAFFLLCGLLFNILNVMVFRPNINHWQSLYYRLLVKIYFLMAH